MTNELEFTKSGIRWTLVRRSKARSIIKEALATAKRLEEGTQQRFGVRKAFDKNGKPVCAFGCVLAASYVCDETMVKNFLKKSEEKKEEGIHFIDQFPLEGNVGAFAFSLNVRDEDIYPSDIEDALSMIEYANDKTKDSWERRRKKIANALRHFAEVLKKDAGLV